MKQFTDWCKLELPSLKFNPKSTQLYTNQSDFSRRYSTSYRPLRFTASTISSPQKTQPFNLFISLVHMKYKQSKQPIKKTMTSTLKILVIEDLRFFTSFFTSGTTCSSLYSLARVSLSHRAFQMVKLCLPISQQTQITKSQTAFIAFINLLVMDWDQTMARFVSTCKVVNVAYLLSCYVTGLNMLKNPWSPSTKLLIISPIENRPQYKLWKTIVTNWNGAVNNVIIEKQMLLMKKPSKATMGQMISIKM